MSVAAVTPSVLYLRCKSEWGVYFTLLAYRISESKVFISQPLVPGSTAWMP
jgi:hypothetical protein